MKDYSTHIAAILRGQERGLTFVGIVRKLHDCYEEPTLPEMQAALEHLVHNQDITMTGGYMKRTHFIDPEYAPDIVDGYVLVDEALDMNIGTFATWQEAWKAASVDWFGTGGNLRRIYRTESNGDFLWSPDGLDSAPAYIGSWAQPYMPKCEHRAPAPMSTDDIINAEITAVREALGTSLNKSLYTRLREEAEDDKVKLAFSVEVDIEACSVIAKMSGSIKITNKAQVEVKDPRQLELNLGKEGGKS